MQYAPEVEVRVQLNQIATEIPVLSQLATVLLHVNWLDAQPAPSGWTESKITNTHKVANFCAR